MEDKVKKMWFVPSWDVVGRMEEYPQDTIRLEPMVFACNKSRAVAFGGIIMENFVDLLPEGKWIIDSKVTMLMKRMWPCIPGWHHDDVPRTRKDGQPDYMNPRWNAAEHIATVIGDASLTEFIDQKVELPLPRSGTIYQKWDKLLGGMKLRTRQIRSGDLVAFEAQTLHRGMPATESGWRIFIRASIGSTRKFYNERRTQVQVYVDDPSLGW